MFRLIKKVTLKVLFISLYVILKQNRGVITKIR